MQSHVAPEMTCPVFGSKSGLLFESWLKTWSKILLKLVLEVELTKLAGSLMNPLKIVTSTHTGISQFYFNFMFCKGYPLHVVIQP